jgi:hypothetical protein
MRNQLSFNDSTTLPRIVTHHGREQNEKNI